MNEAFLHYIWEFQYFSKTDLCTTAGETVSIFDPGKRNSNAGPDFFNARVKIGSIEWIGNVEIHINASGWTQHKHDTDAAYENVVLHVVWKEDKKILRSDRSGLPTIELRNKVPEKLLLQYKKLINNPHKIPCAPFFSQVAPITKISMLDKALMTRLETKAKQIDNVYTLNNNDWEETCYQLLCKNFGFKVNAEPFQQLATSLPYKTILKHADKPVQVEALLFGQAGFLETEKGDEYYTILQREYLLLGKKYQLYENRLNKLQWKFLRLRPANFPSMRLAQLAGLLSAQKNIFSRIIEVSTYKDLIKLFSNPQSSYWRHHYQFFKPMKEEIALLGEMSIENIIINTVVPLMVSYGKAKDEQRFVDRAVDILQHVSSEKNAIINSWKEMGVNSKSAFDSQALIELHNNFCLKRRCLDCTIGYSIIQPSRA